MESRRYCDDLDIYGRISLTPSLGSRQDYLALRFGGIVGHIHLPPLNDKHRHFVGHLRDAYLVWFRTPHNGAPGAAVAAPALEDGASVPRGKMVQGDRYRGVGVSPSNQRDKGGIKEWLSTSRIWRSRIFGRA